MIPIRLSELSRRIYEVLDESFRSVSFWVIADITNHSFKAQKNYHNFELVEKDPLSNDIVARIQGKAWGKGTERIALFEKVTGQLFTNNINVLLNVSVNYHSVFGLQVNVNDIDVNFTLGVLEQQKQATLERLVAENPGFIQKMGDRYITRNNQLAFSIVIQKIALISSANSAGAEDFRHTLLNNTQGYLFETDFYHTEVQGENNADNFLQKIIEVFQSGKRYDALVIIRGGGSQSDFLIFDNYRIARALAKFPIPVITGIGHQKNETIADLMVHTQTKTPTKAAEFIIAHNRQFEDEMISLQNMILIRTQQLFSTHFQALAQHSNGVVNHSRSLLNHYKDSLVQINQSSIQMAKTILFSNRTLLLQVSSQLTSMPRMILANLASDIRHAIGDLNNLQLKFIKSQQGYLQHHISLFRMMAPDNILRKGFAIVKVKNQITSNAADIQVGDEIDIILSNTEIKTTVKQKSTYDGSDFNI